MRRSAEQARRRRTQRGIFLLAFATLLACSIAVARPVEASAEAGGQLVAEPIASAAAAGVRQLFGASPQESPGEVWGVGEAPKSRSHIVRYTEAGGWEAVPDPVEASGEPVALSSSGIPLTATAGRTTPAGGVVTVATLEGAQAPEALIVRNPGGPFRAITPPIEPVTEPILGGDEQLFLNGPNPKVRVAAVEEPDGDTGAFVVPSSGNAGKGLDTAVLHYDGTEWSREKICLSVVGPECNTASTKLPPAGFSVLAIEASGSGQAWMLAKNSNRKESIILLRREGGVWRKHELLGALGLVFGKTNPTVLKGLTIGAREAGQPLTVTSQGLWVDATTTIGERHSDATIYYEIASGEVTGSWCELPAGAPESAQHEVCRFPLGSELPAGEGRSFAWPGSGAPGDFGTRAITGVGQGAMLLFENSAFSRIPLSGNGGSSAGAALNAPEGQLERIEGWLGPSYRLTRAPVPNGLASWPVPFRRPLLAIAPQPGAPVGSLTSKALAVGALGEVARYLPGVGWQPESLLTGSGARATPNLRAVAWPTINFAYAVGDEGAMWLWRASTGLWEPDPGAPPNLIRGDFTGIAFDPNEPERGYAVGKQGLLLGYAKRWTQERLPAGISPEANITSIAFAGDEALATWTLAVPPKGGSSEPEYIGGLITNTGSGWQVDEGASAALSELENEVAPRRIAALPDGGAVIVGLGGGVIEREAAGAPWHTVPGPLLGYPSAVAAIREGGQLRALVSAGETLFELNSDRAQALGQPPEGQAPLLTEPYPLPATGFLVRQTATGWQDEERDAFPAPPRPTDQKSTIATHLDLPREPDPLLAILTNPEGTEGWAVGGQTGERASKEFGAYIGEGLQTASVMRYGPTAAPPGNAASVPLSTSPAEATFAIGGGAQCEGACADLANTGIGPDVWLRGAVGRAASISGVRAFLYTGGSISENLDLTKVSAQTFAEEESAYAHRLGSAAGTMPVFAAPSQGDRYESSLAAFGAAFNGFSAPLGFGVGTNIHQVEGGEGERATGNYSYAFDSTDSTSANVVRVIVLDESVTLPERTLCWLGGQLARAKAEGAPAIVVGDRDAQGEAELTQLLVTGVSPRCPQLEPGGASAYFFKAEGNTQSMLSWGSATLPDFGTGSLGYIAVPEASRQELVPASGFLLASVNLVARSRATNVAPVSVRLIPSIGSLAINALDGTLLRRSQTALFEGLARRPVAGEGCTSQGGACLPTSPDPYAQIPARCVNGHGYKGRPCSVEIPPEYRFSSSSPDIANFVEVDPNSSNPRAVFLGSNGKTVADPTSGLLCAFNSGTTTVSIEAGGLAYSVPVIVQAGSVQRPCGTVPRTDLSAPQPLVTPPPPPLPSKPPFKTPKGALPPPPAPPAVTPVTPTNPIPVPPSIPVAHPVPAKPPAPLQLPYFAPAPVLSPIVVIVPPPPPPAVEPTPPSGTSPVTQPAVSPEPEEEEEAAFDLVHHAVAYLPGDRRPPAVQVAASSSRHGGLPNAFLPALLILAAVALAGTARPRLRRSPEPAFDRNRPQRRPFDEQP